jgi:phosphoribosyl 1,2-cyclic phosphodiesterase
MEITFWGVRGSIPSPGPFTVRYGGNTSCVSVHLTDGSLIIIDLGTGARALGNTLLTGPFGKGLGSATVLLSHHHWDHIQGFPFFGPFYVQGNRFTVVGGARSERRLEEVLERQMASQFFPVQTYRNMGASIELATLPENGEKVVGRTRIRAQNNPHGATQALAFRIEAEGKSLVYASDAGYGKNGPSAETLALYRNADLLIHDCTFTPEDRVTRMDRGLSSLDDALQAACSSLAKKLVLFHYDQDYTDHQIDQLVLRGRRSLHDRGMSILEIVGAAEGLTLTI